MTDQSARKAEVSALREWRRKNGLPEIADPPLHWSDVPVNHDRLWDRFFEPFEHVLTALARLRRHRAASDQQQHPEEGR